MKNASDMRCRCAYTAARRSCMTRWPTWFEIHVCATLITPLMTASAIIPPTSQDSSVRSCSRMPLSTASRSRNGEATLEDRAEDDQRQQQAQAQAVGDEQPADAPQRDGSVGDVLGARLGAVVRAGALRPTVLGRRAGCSPSLTAACHRRGRGRSAAPRVRSRAVGTEPAVSTVLRHGVRGHRVSVDMSV